MKKRKETVKVRVSIPKELYEAVIELGDKELRNFSNQVWHMYDIYTNAHDERVYLFEGAKKHLKERFMREGETLNYAVNRYFMKIIDDEIKKRSLDNDGSGRIINFQERRASLSG